MKKIEIFEQTTSKFNLLCSTWKLKVCLLENVSNSFSYVFKLPIYDVFLQTFLTLAQSADVCTELPGKNGCDLSNFSKSSSNKLMLKAVIKTSLTRKLVYKKVLDEAISLKTTKPCIETKPKNQSPGLTPLKSCIEIETKCLSPRLTLPKTPTIILHLSSRQTPSERRENSYNPLILSALKIEFSSPELMKLKTYFTNLLLENRQSLSERRKISCNLPKKLLYLTLMSLIKPKVKLAKLEKLSQIAKVIPSRYGGRNVFWLRLLLINGGTVETNPGPGDHDRDRPSSQANLRVTSYNVRGLNDEKKLRHLINKVYKDDGGKNLDYVVCFQETFIGNVGKIPYLWRGNMHLTPGTGSSCGCLTLISPHLNILSTVDIENRAHVIACQRNQDNEASYIIANLYAPNPNNADKIQFFDKIFDTVYEQAERYNCTKVIIAGDFNLIFHCKEAKNRLYTAQEKRVADAVKDQIGAGQLKDSWVQGSSFTWRRPNTNIFSTIDRILFTEDTLELVKINVDWSYSFSDHGAVMASYRVKSRTYLRKSKITRLDPSLAVSPHYGPLIDQGVKTMIETIPPDWNPHLRLEFLKVCIRTVVEKIQAERKSYELAEEASLNEELDTAIEKLSRGSLENENNLINYVEELRAKKQVLIEEKGARLAAKLGTKWFNEGEKSTRYFMRLLNRAMPDNFEVLQDEAGEIVTAPDKIEEMIVCFYKKLYEDENNIVQDNDHAFFDNISPISEQDNDEISKEVTNAELKETLKTCVDSSPGPDGIPYSFLRLLWPIYGDILTEAWRFSLANSCLPPSHKTSFLKLIPKAGKDLKKLTNWRPITLSNCDHKLITKTYSKRICERVAEKVNGGQTAYLKNRLINDNIRALLSTVNLTNLEIDTNGLLVALDAKKAFDSVSHSYIEKCLRKFGCGNFVPIFRTLYKDLKTDIIINGKITPGFVIRRGVKQGDALSCVLFILCMEPLLRNIENNPEIEPINSTTLACTLPKVYAYADDVNCAMRDSERSMRALFSEYERLTLMSGLELNADKTELLRLGNDVNKSYAISYRGQNHQIESSNEIKINGVLFQRDREALVQRNVDAVIKKMDQQFKLWSRRSLSTLGKILIAKTFGISQAIYLMQSISLNHAHYKKINAIVYKFIWNRHYLAAKAPERIKREVVTNCVKNGGLGMLDITELGDSLKLRALGRLRSSEHPFLKILNSKLNLESYFDPKLDVSEQVDPITMDGVCLLKADREKLWLDPKLDSNCLLLSAIRDAKLKDIVDRRGHNSIAFFRVWARGSRKIGDLSLADLNSLSRHLNRDKLNKLKLAVNLNLGPPEDSFKATYYTGQMHRSLNSLTSKEIRSIRSQKLPIQVFKIGLNLTLGESLNWGSRLSKLTSTRHKNTLLRVAHGDVYTKDKLHRFGMADDNKCYRCNDAETLKHKFIECAFVNRIWATANPSLEKLGAQLPLNLTKAAMAASTGSTLEAMTLNAELLQVILYLKPNPNYLLHPKHLVLNAVKALAAKEGNKRLKDNFIELLNETNSN